MGEKKKGASEEGGGVGEQLQDLNRLGGVEGDGGYRDQVGGVEGDGEVEGCGKVEGDGGYRDQAHPTNYELPGTCIAPNT